MTLRRFCRVVVRAVEGDTARAVAIRMRDAHVGCAVIVRGEVPIGVVTDRDLAVRVVAAGLDPNATPIGDAATYDPICVEESAGCLAAIALIRERGIRRLPIVSSQGALVGIVTVDDLLIELGSQMAGLAEGIEANADATESR